MLIMVFQSQIQVFLTECNFHYKLFAWWLLVNNKKKQTKKVCHFIIFFFFSVLHFFNLLRFGGVEGT